MNKIYFAVIGKTGIETGLGPLIADNEADPLEWVVKVNRRYGRDKADVATVVPVAVIPVAVLDFSKIEAALSRLNHDIPHGTIKEPWDGDVWELIEFIDKLKAALVYCENTESRDALCQLIKECPKEG